MTQAAVQNLVNDLSKAIAMSLAMVDISWPRIQSRSGKCLADLSTAKSAVSGWPVTPHPPELQMLLRTVHAFACRVSVRVVSGLTG